jgi:hypothetical protein
LLPESAEFAENIFMASERLLKHRIVPVSQSAG